MTANAAGSKLAVLTLGRRHAMRACLTIAVFVSVLATLGAAAARADEPVDPAATTSAEPTPEATSSEQPTVVPESPSPEPGEGDGGPTGAGTGGGEGGGAATSTGEEVAGTEQAPVVEGSLAAVAENARDPRASIGDIDCTNGTVPVTLDNSRSTETVFYQVLAADAFADESENTFEDTIEVSAGDIQVVAVPVTEDTVVEVYVAALDDDWSATLADAFLTVDCTDDDDPFDPKAKVGGVDCGHMTVDVTLDNSRSEQEVEFVVTMSLAVEDDPFYGDSFELPAGDTETLHRPVTENLPVRVFVGAGDGGGSEGLLVDELVLVDCTPGDEPRVDVGLLSCTNLTVDVTLDNSRSPVRTWFEITVITGAPEDWFGDATFNEVFSVAVGAERVISVPVPNNDWIDVLVQDGNQLGGRPLAEQAFDVDCARVLGGRSGPGLASDGALAATGANGMTLPIAGLALLACGGFLSMLGRRTCRVATPASTTGH